MFAFPESMKILKKADVNDEYMLDSIFRSLFMSCFCWLILHVSGGGSKNYNVELSV